MKHFLQTWLASWVKRRQGADTLPVTVHRRRLYILPTRGGFAFAALLFFMLVAGLNYTNSLALFLTFLLTGFALVAMHQCHRNLLSVSLNGIVPLPAFAGETALLQLTLGNETGLMRHAIEASVLDEPAVALDLPPRSTQRLELALSAPKRSVIRIERIQLSTTYPFGLFRAWTWAHLPVEVIVYPRPHGSLPMPADHGRRSGQRSQVGVGTEEWLGLRPFRDGDSPRQVAWKAYAHGASLLVKEYSAAGSELRLFDFERLAQLDTEARLEQLARWIVDAETRGERYGLRIAEYSIEPHRGPEHRHRCLSALARQ
jgi:Uncharacterized conserved protein (some members contain a von Willebrand factor type A (vWA) domain)